MGEMPMPNDGMTSMVWMRMPGQSWPGFAAAFLGMWMTMMVPMMVPPFTVMLWRWRRVATRTGATGLGSASVMVAAGYFAVWSAIGAAMLPIVLAVSGIIEGTAETIVVAGAIALIVAASSLSARKPRRAARRAASPRDATAWRQGVSLGVSCARSCGPLMLLTLIAGGMDWRLMGAVAVVITLERLIGRPVVLDSAQLAGPLDSRDRRSQFVEPLHRANRSDYGVRRLAAAAIHDDRLIDRVVEA